MFSFLSPNPTRRYVGRFASSEKPGYHSCMRLKAMTPQEEMDFCKRTLRAIAERPKDFSFGRHHIYDCRTGVELQVTGHVKKKLRVRLRSSDYDVTSLRKGTTKKLLKALHDLRHEVEVGIAREAHQRQERAERAIAEEQKRVAAKQEAAVRAAEARERTVDGLAKLTDVPPAEPKKVQEPEGVGD